MNDYHNRRQPTVRFCPRCMGHSRVSIVMSQPWGGDQIRLTCADYSICSWSEVLDFPGSLDGQVGITK